MKNLNCEKHSYKSASGMLVVLFLLTIFVVVSAFSFYQVSADIRQNARYVFEEKAFWLAESGVSFAEYALRNNAWTGWTDLSGDKYYTKSTTVGDFEVFVTGAGTNNGSISSFGYIPNKSVANKYVKNIIVAFDGEDDEGRLFPHALFSKNNVLIKNDVIIDSYRSDEGPYGGANVNANGTVGAHSSSLTLQNNVVVYGNLEVLETTGVKTHHNSSYTGEIIISEESDLEAEVVPEDLEAVESAGTLGLTGSDVLTLNSGNYAYTKVDMDSNAQIVVNGDVKLRIDNSLNLSDAANIIVNGTLTIYTSNGISMDNASTIRSDDLKPADIIVYGPGNNASSEFNDQSTFYGVVYAPDGRLSFNDQAQVFGAVAARIANYSQESQLHYDELLGEEGAGGTPWPDYEQITWHEV